MNAECADFGMNLYLGTIGWMRTDGFGYILARRAYYGSMSLGRFLRIVSLLAITILGLPGQIIEFESGGYKYQTLTRNGLTIMFAQLPAHVRGYAILQVAISNGSKIYYTVKPENFVYYREDGSAIEPTPARDVVNSLVEKASRGDVVKLVTAYESSIYGNTRYKSTNGYEQRRQSALAEVSSAKIKAAAAASAISFVQTRLAPGQSTDGAVFYSNSGRMLGAGKLMITAAGATFEFPMVSSN